MNSYPITLCYTYMVYHLSFIISKPILTFTRLDPLKASLLLNLEEPLMLYLLYYSFIDSILFHIPYI